MKKLGIIANCKKLRAPEVLKRLGEKAHELGLVLFTDKPTSKLLKRCKVVPRNAIFQKADAIVAMGGDGTMLRAVRELDGRNKPVIGVNIGGLGFMTSVAQDDLDRALECLARNKFTESERVIMESVVISGGKRIARYRALNDVVIRSAKSVRILSLDMTIDKQHVTSYACDGLIVSTPTGSTGHSMSAGGPILSPETPAFVISLICPHSLSSRPLVVPDESTISIQVAESDGDVVLSIDGQVGSMLAQGDRIEVKRSGKGVRFIHLPGHSYFAVLRQKLHWRGSSIG
jgi:NAD+ kinase